MGLQPNTAECLALQLQANRVACDATEAVPNMTRRREGDSHILHTTKQKPIFDSGTRDPQRVTLSQYVVLTPQ